MAVKAKASITLARVNDGAAGKGVKSTSITYQAWKDGTTTPTGVWSPTPPKTTAENPYLWTRTITTYTDGAISTAYSVGSTPEGVVIGGRNLVLDSGVEHSSSNNLNASYKISPYEGGILGDGRGFLVEGETYTCTICWTPGEGIADIRGFSSDGSMRLFQFEAIQPNIKQVDSQSFKMSYSDEKKPTDNPIFANINIFKHPNLDSIVNKIHWIKIEKGNKATDWTPAPEDIDTEIDKAQSDSAAANHNSAQAQEAAKDAANTADQANKLANSNKAWLQDWSFSGEATIDGGKIQAKTVTAEQLNVKELAALSADLGVVTAGVIQSADGNLKLDLNSSDGLRIRSANKSTELIADGEGTRVVDSAGNKVAEFTSSGTETKQIKVSGKSELSGILIEPVGDEIWISRVI